MDFNSTLGNIYQTILSKKYRYYWLAALLIPVVLYISSFFISFKGPKTVWDLCPDHLVMAFEIPQIFESYEELKKQAFWEEIANVDYLYLLSDRLSKLQSIVKQDRQFEQFFKSKTAFVSLHNIGKDGFGVLFFLPVKEENDKEQVKNMIFRFQKDKNYQFDNRIFKDYQITEVRHQGQEDIFSFLFFEGYLIASYSPGLIEDLIRKAESGKDNLFFENSEELRNQFNGVKSGKITVYVNPAKIPDFLGIHSEGKLIRFFEPFGKLANICVMNMIPEKNAIRFAGISFTKDTQSAELLNIFQGQLPKNLSLKPFIPANTAMIMQFGFSNKEKFYRDLQAYHQFSNLAFYEKQAEFRTKYQFDVPYFYGLLEGEVALLVTNNDSIENGRLSKYVLLKTASPEALKYLKNIGLKSAKISDKGLDRAFSKTFQGVQIERLYIEEFPSMLFTDLLGGFPSCYYASIGNCILLAESVEEAEAWINAVKSEEVWSKTLNHKALNAILSKKSNLTFCMDISQIWSALYQNASPIWRERMEIYGPELQYTDFLSFQVLHQKDNRFNSEFAFLFKEALGGKSAVYNYSALKEVAFPNVLYSKPWLVKNPADNTYQIMVQDNLNELYLLNEQGLVLMKANLGGIIQGSPMEVDFYKNNRWQYAYIIKDRFSIIDRNGKTIQPFPFFLPEEELPYSFNVFDFGNTKQYFFIITSTDNTMYMIDENRRFVKGWNLKRFDSRLAFPPQTFRYIDKDYILVGLENGRVFLYDREGNTMQGFPVQLKGRITSPFFISESEEGLQPVFVCLTSRNMLVDIGFNGDILRLNSLKKSRPQNGYELIFSQNKTEWLIAEKGANSLTVMDNKGKKLFEKYYDVAGRLKLQYFVFKNGVSIIAANHETEKLTYLYDLEGNLLATLKSSKEIEARLLDKERKLMIYKVDGRTLSTAFINLK